nr:integrase core domain-containing protein [Reticulibacter mediterranei]
MSEQRDEQLVTAAFQMAVAQRHPKAELLHYSDRGASIRAWAIRRSSAQHGIAVSMNRKGNCYDNAMMESFFGTLKEEWAERHRFENRREARTAIFSYIETFYNRKRRHSSLGYVSPLAFEERELWRKEKGNI